MTYGKKPRTVDKLADAAAADLPLDGPFDFDRMTLRRDPAAFAALVDYYGDVGETRVSERHLHSLLEALRYVLDARTWRELVEQVEGGIAAHRSAGFQLGAAAQRLLAQRAQSTST